MMRSHKLGIEILILLLLIGCGRQPAKVVTPLDKAKSLLASHDYKLAEDVCRKVLATNDRDTEARLLLVQLLKRQEKHEEALEECSRAISLSLPDDSRGYEERRNLLMFLASQAEDKEERWRLQSQAAQDQNMIAAVNPDAAAAFSKVRSDISEVLSRPIPELELPENPYEEIDKALSAEKGTKKEAKKDQLAATNQTEDGPADREAEPEDKPKETTLVETAADYAERVSREAEIILDKELDDELQDPVLPPHPDPLAAPLPQVPESPITRLGLPAQEDGIPLVPRRRSSVSTGIRQIVESPEETTQAPTRNRFLLQNQFGNMQEGIRTGIGSSKSRLQRTGSLSPLIPRYGLVAQQSGLLPADARESFGPRLAISPETTEEAESSTLERPGTRAIPPIPTANSPILTTALPGTEIRFGVGNGNPSNTPATLSTARDSEKPKNRRSQFGRISDPTFTPFGKRPTGAALPTLPPPRTSN